VVDGWGSGVHSWGWGDDASVGDSQESEESDELQTESGNPNVRQLRLCCNVYLMYLECHFRTEKSM
jgi:hypothetical protein